MNNTDKIEVIKIGNIIRDLSKIGKETVMIISDGDEIINFYVSIFKDNYNKDKYNILKTSGSIVGKSSLLYSGKPVTGFPDDYPKIGQVFTINNGSWHTSLVIDVIEECVLITRNSIYAIHNESNMREIKLNKIL
jgi:hypothetical protein